MAFILAVSSLLLTLSVSSTFSDNSDESFSSETKQFLRSSAQEDRTLFGEAASGSGLNFGEPNFTDNFGFDSSENLMGEDDYFTNFGEEEEMLRNDEFMDFFPNNYDKNPQALVNDDYVGDDNEVGDDTLVNDDNTGIVVKEVPNCHDFVGFFRVKSRDLILRCEDLELPEYYWGCRWTRLWQKCPYTCGRCKSLICNDLVEEIFMFDSHQITCLELYNSRPAIIERACIDPIVSNTCPRLCNTCPIYD